MNKKEKIFLFILILIILGYVLFPKNTGFTEESEYFRVLGQHYRCFGIELSQKIGNRTFFRCIGVPFGKITI